MRPYYEDNSCVIYHGDCRDVLALVGLFDLCTFDPPYNVGKPYDGYADNLAPEEYRAWLVDVLAGCDARTLTWFPGAIACLDLLPLLSESAWTFRRLLAWHKKEYAGDVFHSGPAMCWEPIVWAHRGDWFHNRIFGAWGRDLLVVNATHGDPLRASHPCPKPPEVLRWLIGLFCPEGGSVLDPTMGVGTALLEAKYLGRTAVGIEKSERYCEIAAKRLAQEVLDFGAAK
jgi:site-specific DNA-methyltransferase (adenine-specific)